MTDVYGGCIVVLMTQPVETALGCPHSEATLCVGLVQHLYLHNENSPVAAYCATHRRKSYCLHLFTRGRMGVRISQKASKGPIGAGGLASSKALWIGLVSIVVNHLIGESASEKDALAFTLSIVGQERRTEPG